MQTCGSIASGGERVVAAAAVADAVSGHIARFRPSQQAGAATHDAAYVRHLIPSGFGFVYSDFFHIFLLSFTRLTGPPVFWFCVQVKIVKINSKPVFNILIFPAYTLLTTASLFIP